MARALAVLAAVLIPSISAAERPPSPDRSLLVVRDTHGEVIGPYVDGMVWTEIHGILFAIQFDGGGFSISPPGTPIGGLYSSANCTGTALVAVLPSKIVQNELTIIGTTGYYEPRSGGEPTVVNSSGVPLAGKCNQIGPTSAVVVPWATIDLTAFLSDHVPPFSLSLAEEQKRGRE